MWTRWTYEDSFKNSQAGIYGILSSSSENYMSEHNSFPSDAGNLRKAVGSFQPSESNTKRF